MENEKKNSSVEEIMQNRSAAETTRREVEFIEKTGNLTVDVYNNYPPKALGIDAVFKDPRVVAQNEYLMMQNAVLTGCHNEPNGNCYVSKASIDSAKTARSLKDGEKMDQVIQVFWAKDGSEKSRFTEVVNASKLQEKFVPHNKSVSLEEQKEVVKMLQEKFLSGMEDGARKDGLPKWDAAKNIAYVPASENEQQVMKDTIAMVSSSIVARDSVAGSEIRFKREVSKEEKILLRHFVASEIRTKLGLGPDERNGLSRESTTDKKNVVNAMKRNERLCGNVARRARGIVNKIGREFGLEVLNSQAVKRGKDTKEQSQEQSKSL